MKSPTLDDLIAWLEKQPAAGEYNYVCTQSNADCPGCVLSQFFRHFYGQDVVCGPTTVRLRGQQDDTALPYGWNQIAVGKNRDDDSPREWTYGAALERARLFAAGKLEIED
jgi:hypothetical protein